MVDPPVPGSRPPAGRIRVDCHLHTVASGDSVLTVEELAARAKEEGLGAVFITDHNVTAAAADAATRDLGVRVIIGEEVRTPHGDVIGLFLTERIPYVLPLPEVVARIRSQRALVYVPHPFDPVRASLGRTGAGDALTALCSAGAADIIEVFNAKTADQSHNERAARLAERFGLPGGRGGGACRAAPAPTRTTRLASAPPTWRCPTSTARRASSPHSPRRGW